MRQLAGKDCENFVNKDGPILNHISCHLHTKILTKIPALLLKNFVHCIKSDGRIIHIACGNVTEFYINFLEDLLLMFWNTKSGAKNMADFGLCWRQIDATGSFCSWYILPLTNRDPKHEKMLTPSWFLKKTRFCFYGIFLFLSKYIDFFSLGLFFTALTNSSFLLCVSMQQITYQRGNSSHVDSGESFEKAFLILTSERQVIIQSIIHGYALSVNKNDIRIYSRWSKKSGPQWNVARIYFLTKNRGSPINVSMLHVLAYLFRFRSQSLKLEIMNYRLRVWNASVTPSMQIKDGGIKNIIIVY